MRVCLMKRKKLYQTDKWPTTHTHRQQEQSRSALFLIKYSPIIEDFEDKLDDSGKTH